MSIGVFTTFPRSADIDVFREGAKRTFEFTEAAGFMGALLYTGNDVPVEPWFLALPQAGEKASVALEAATRKEPRRERTPRVDRAERLRRTFAVGVIGCGFLVGGRS